MAQAERQGKKNAGRCGNSRAAPSVGTQASRYWLLTRDAAASLVDVEVDVSVRKSDRTVEPCCPCMDVSIWLMIRLCIACVAAVRAGSRSLSSSSVRWLWIEATAPRNFER